MKKRVAAIVTAVSILSAQCGMLMSVSADTAFSFSDTFDSYETVDDLLSQWSVSDSLKSYVTLDGEAGANRALKLKSTNDVNSKTAITKTFGRELTDNEFTIEMTVKSNTSFDIILTDTANKKIAVAGANGTRMAGCYEDTSRITPGNTRVSTKVGYKRIKLSVNKAEKTLKLTSTSMTEPYTYTYILGDLKAISIRVGTAPLSWVYIDEIAVKTKTDNSGAYASFNGTKDYYGGMFYSVVTPGNAGITLNCATELAPVNGITYYNINKSKGTVRIELDEDAGIIYDNFKNVQIDIEYLDNDYGFLVAEYDTKNGLAETSTVDLKNSGEVKTQTFVVKDWVKNPTTGGYLLTLKTYDGNIKDGKINSAERTYSKYPVTVKSVRIQNNGDISQAEVTMQSDNTGNIFHGNETPAFNITVDNIPENISNLTCVVSCYELGKDNEEFVTERLIYNEAVEIGGNNTVAVKIPQATKYGLYKLEAEVTDGSNSLCVGETEFSKSAQVATQNYTMGVSSHFDQLGGATEGMELLKKAGMGLVREDFIWSDYEAKKEQYALNDNQIEVCNAAKANNLKLLMIVSGINWNYDGAHGGGFPTQEVIDNQFNSYVTHLLNEPKVKEVCDMVEIMNEPDLQTYQNGVVLEDTSLPFDKDYSEEQNSKNQKFSARGTAYGKILKSVSKNIKDNAPGYKIGGFSLASQWLPEANYFMDRALAELDDVNTFDTISCHPYMWLTQDAEKGYGGNDSTNPLHYVGYKLDYIKALATGGQVYNDTTKEYESPQGMATGSTYSQNLTEPLWITEYGASSADYKDDGLSCKNEYDQAIYLVRGYNQIKLNNFNNKVWFYNFADIGDRTNEKEFSFGMLHSRTNNVPFAAKYAYIALSALNKLTENATSVESVKEDNYKFITKYTSSARETYMLWTTKDTEQRIAYDFGNDVKFYDLLGNEIDQSEVLDENGYILTREPYYAVVGNAIQ